MFPNRTPHQIAQQWQDDVEQCMEAGIAPVMELGASFMLTDDLASLLAIQRWSSLRTDLTTPALPCGGVSPQWMAVLLSPSPRFDEASPPLPVVIYAGTNQAEYLMTAGQAYASATPSAAGAGLFSRGAAIPVSYFIPRSQPGMSLTWDLQPFQQVHTPPHGTVLPPVESDPTDDASGEKVANDPLRDWLAWAGLLLALFLIILASLV